MAKYAKVGSKASKLDNTRNSRFGSARDPRNHGVTLRPFLSPLRHMEQLLLVTSCDSPAGIGASLRTHGITNGLTDGQTDVTLKIVF